MTNGATNRSFGLTTLENRHAKSMDRDPIRFRGKSGQPTRRPRPSAGGARRRVRGPAGQARQHYEGGNGVPHDVGSDDVNDYPREISGATSRP
jgi:DNA topoisomerase-1